MKASTFQLTPIQKVLASFLLLILSGATLLKIPFATTSPISFVDALFTSTSAVCVTGLIVKDTAKDFTIFGKTIIAVLIQFGGLGIMTFSLAMLSMFQKSISIKWRFAFENLYSDIKKVPIRSLLARIVLYTFFFESIIATVLFFIFLSDHNASAALGHAIFHSISAFCNAGFSTFSNNLESYRGNIPLNIAIMLAIVIGGMGFVVIHEIRRQFAYRTFKNFFIGLSHHSRLVLITTIILIFSGASIIFLFESNYSMATLSNGEKILASFFQSITCRTAGFNTVDISKFRQSTQLFMIVLMFIGGSPGSIAGGVKTTTAAIVMLMIIAKFKGQRQILLWKRAIDEDTIERSMLLVMLSLLFILTSCFFIMAIDLFDLTEQMLKVLFETVSAFGTVGLSLGTTSKLTDAGKLLICLVMFVGRLGPLTLVMALAERKQEIQFHYPEEHIMIG
ncbi:MAG: TrkH family potassium uptake protein [Spirochaetes bacterium]|nr:TrkH family potassium uptake protein [Spirochaetota bacterium]